MRVSSKSGLMFLCLGVLVRIWFGCSGTQNQVTISVGSDDPRVGFAVSEIKRACSERQIDLIASKNHNSGIVLKISSDNPEIEPEGFRISVENGKVSIEASDTAGIMYGGLELAEQIRISGWKGVSETLQNPYMKIRGTKFNIPLDVRTPSYSDASDPAQFNLPEMWNFDFWSDYIDQLARYRYNFISLWSLHPFPSMVRVPAYPDIALDDVRRSTVKWEEYYHTHGTGLDAPGILSNYETVRKMTMDEKIEFWRKVMRYAKGRNIDFAVVTWNIFVNGTKGKYGITDQIDNEITRNYFRESVKQLLITYPDLAGIGLTTGENMPGSGLEEKESWAYETYARALMEVAEEQPDRNFKFIHRLHWAGINDIREKFEPLINQGNIEFLFSFKYAQAHVYSSTVQKYHERYIDDFRGIKTMWTLRNDDVYYFRWGAPDFVRDFIKNIPYDVSKGFYYGSDQWVWGRDFLTRDTGSPRELEIVKHWYHWMLWGRLGYNPDIGNERFVSIIQHHFPEADAGNLFKAWQDASMIYPLTTGFHWGALDFQWYIEGCKSRPGPAQTESGFHDVNRFITLPPHPNSGYQSVPDYVDMTLEDGVSDLYSPHEVSAMIHKRSDDALAYVESCGAVNQKELQYVLNDIKTMGFLGKYYAHKIAGATNLALFRKKRDPVYREDAVKELEMALKFWVKYVATALSQNLNPVWLNRVGHVHWEELTAEVRKDIDIARNDK